MKKSLFLALFSVLLLASVSYGQEAITMEKVFGGYKFTQGDKSLKLKELIKALESNKQASDYTKKIKSNYTGSVILGGLGGGLIGWSLGTAIGGGKPNWTLAAVGAAFVGASIPLTSGFNKNAKKAVELYNSGLKTAQAYIKPKYNFIASTNGVGVAVVF